MPEPLLVAQLDAAQIQHAVLHRHIDLLAAPGGVALEQRGDNTQRQMQAGAEVTDLRPGHQRRAVVETGGGRRAARALRDIFVNLAVRVGPRPKTFDRGQDHPWVEFLDSRPGKSHAVECAGGEIFHHHVARFHQRFEDFFADFVAAVDLDRALVVVQHGEIQAVHAFDVLQLTARDVADARALDLDHVGAKPSQKLGASGARLDMGEV